MSEKIRVPHGEFKRRFTHKRRPFFGRKKVFDAQNQRWVAQSRIEADYALMVIIDSLPDSDLAYPSKPVTRHFVKCGYESWDREAVAEAAIERYRSSNSPVRFEEEILGENSSNVSTTEREPAYFGGFESASSSRDFGSSFSSSDSGSSFSSSSSSSDSGSFD